MKWNRAEIEQLSPILERLQAGCSRDPASAGCSRDPLARDAGSATAPQAPNADAIQPAARSILVLCSAGGEVPVWLAQHLPQVHIHSLELSPDALAAARRLAAEQGLEQRVQFSPADKTHIPFPDNTFDGLVSEFILFPTPMPTEISQPEMARVLKPGSSMLITDVIVATPISRASGAEQLLAAARPALQAIGLDYMCEATPADFCSWMEAAGLVDVAVEDLTRFVRPVWEQRRRDDLDPAHQEGYSLLLEDPDTQLGEAIFYIYVQGRKPYPKLL